MLLCQLNVIAGNSDPLVCYKEHICRADSRFVPSQWETVLLCNDVSHWLCASLESSLICMRVMAMKFDILNHISLRHDNNKALLFIVFINSLWPSDAIWRHGSVSTLAQVMACCLMAPSHYLNQFWVMISAVLWHSPDSNFTENT